MALSRGKTRNSSKADFAEGRLAQWKGPRIKPVRKARPKLKPSDKGFGNG